MHDHGKSIGDQGCTENKTVCKKSVEYADLFILLWDPHFRRFGFRSLGFFGRWHFARVAVRVKVSDL